MRKNFTRNKLAERINLKLGYSKEESKEFIEIFLNYIKVNINNNVDSSLKLSELYISLEDIELDEFEYDKKLNKLISICEVCKFDTQYNY